MKKRKMLYILGILLVVVMLPYLYSRIVSGWNAVEIHHIKLDQLAKYYPQYNKRLNVGTYNIAHGRGARLGARNWQGGSEQARIQRLENIGKVLSQNNLDIVVLNEVDFAATWSHNLNQADIIARAGGYPYVATQRSVDVYTPVAQLRIGNAIISRYPIDSVELKRFKPRSVFENIVAGNHDSLLATISLSDKKRIKIWGVHLEFRDEATRIKAAYTILKEQQATNSEIIVAGDFNSQPASGKGRESAITQLMSSGFYHYYPPRKDPATLTFPTEKPDRALDWIFVPKSYRVMSGQVLNAGYSDHLPVATSLLIP